MVSDGFGHFTFNRKDVGQLAIERIRPKVGISGCLDQLHVHSHGVGALLDTTLQNVSDTELLCDLGQIFRGALVMLRRSTRDHL